MAGEETSSPTSASMAQLAQTSTDAFEDFYFRVCTLDYARMTQAAMPLVERMKRTDQVHIKGPGATDLRFSIKGIGVVPCCGDRNIPDGEVFTAPVRDSVEGVLQYNTPTLHNGNTFTNIRLEFKKGKIVKCDCEGGDRKLLESIFDTDEGARHIGRALRPSTSTNVRSAASRSATICASLSST